MMGILLMQEYLVGKLQGFVTVTRNKTVQVANIPWASCVLVYLKYVLLFFNTALYRPRTSIIAFINTLVET
jgi:hypothetical protein